MQGPRPWLRGQGIFSFWLLIAVLHGFVAQLWWLLPTLECIIVLRKMLLRLGSLFMFSKQQGLASS